MQIGIGFILLIFMIYVLVATPSSRLVYTLVFIAGIMITASPLGQTVRQTVVGTVGGADKVTSEHVKVPTATP